MATPTSFDESNDYLGKPDDMSHEECASLSILRTVTIVGLPCVVSCWKVSQEELEEINRTGRIWLTVVGDTHAPVHVTGIKPFLTDGASHLGG